MPIYRLPTGTPPESNDQSSINPPPAPKLAKELESYIKLYISGIKYLQCDQCQFVCRPLTGLFTSHYATHYTDNPSSNPFLGIHTPVPPEQQITIEEPAPKRSQVHRCTKCDLRFFKLRNYLQHMRSKHKPPLRCGLCSCTYKTKTAYQAHMKRHARPKAVYACDGCDREFHSKHGLSYHLQHTCSPSKCQLCHQVLESSDQLKQHLLEVHQVEADDAQLVEGAKCVCFLCGVVVKEANLDRHLQVHREERPFICNYCGKGFKFKPALRDHIITELGMKDYVCEVCGRKFVKKCYLTKHSKQHLLPNQPSFRCDVCDATFPRQCILSAHCRQHAEVSTYCDLCDRQFPNYAQLLDHQLTDLVCHLCQELFVSHDLLKQHVTARHQLSEFQESATVRSDVSALPVYACDLCGRKFVAEGKYQEHLAEEVACELCQDVVFQSNALLKLHVHAVHNLQEYRKVASSRCRRELKRLSRAPQGDSISSELRRPEYPCDICGKKLLHQRTLEVHKRIHTGQNPFKCEHCSRAFRSKSALSTHMVAEMNLRRYGCSHCDKRYNFQSDLLTHLRQHHEKKQFCCHICGKEFGLLKCLNDHLSMHTTEKPFSCDKCNISFRLKKFLDRHVKKHHQLLGMVDLTEDVEV